MLCLLTHLKFGREKSLEEKKVTDNIGNFLLDGFEKTNIQAEL